MCVLLYNAGILRKEGVFDPLETQTDHRLQGPIAVSPHLTLGPTEKSGIRDENTHK